eukprot:709896-Pyramimonas_sp.AAC.1
MRDGAGYSQWVRHPPRPPRASHEPRISAIARRHKVPEGVHCAHPKRRLGGRKPPAHSRRERFKRDARKVWCSERPVVNITLSHARAKGRLSSVTKRYGYSGLFHAAEDVVYLTGPSCRENPGLERSLSSSNLVDRRSGAGLLADELGGACLSREDCRRVSNSGIFA